MSALIRHFNDREAESPLHIILAQALTRGEKMDFMVQKAVELGVKTFIPLVTERANVRLDAEREAKRMQHWQAIIEGACEQSGRNRLPELMAPMAFESCVKTIVAAHKFILCPEEGVASPNEKWAKETRVLLMIGPEGGFSATEVALAKRSGYCALNLGPRILRAETATIAALTVIQAMCGDMG